MMRSLLKAEIIKKAFEIKRTTANLKIKSIIMIRQLNKPQMYATAKRKRVFVKF